MYSNSNSNDTNQQIYSDIPVYQFKFKDKKHYEEFKKDLLKIFGDINITGKINFSNNNLTVDIFYYPRIFKAFISPGTMLEWFKKYFAHIEHDEKKIIGNLYRNPYVAMNAVLNPDYAKLHKNDFKKFSQMYDEELLHHPIADNSKSKDLKIIKQIETTKEITPELFGNFNAKIIGIGETHHHSNPKNFIIDNLAKLNMYGVDKIYLEGIPYEVQNMLDAYMTSNSMHMPAELKKILESNDSDSSKIKLIQNIKLLKLKIRVIGLDSQKTYLADESHDAAINDRIKSFNYQALQIIKDTNSQGKGLFLVGSDHLKKSNVDKIPGLAAVLSCPAIVISDLSVEEYENYNIVPGEITEDLMRLYSEYKMHNFYSDLNVVHCDFVIEGPKNSDFMLKIPEKTLKNVRSDLADLRKAVNSKLRILEKNMDILEDTNKKNIEELTLLSNKIYQTILDIMHCEAKNQNKERKVNDYEKTLENFRNQAALYLANPSSDESLRRSVNNMRPAEQNRSKINQQREQRETTSLVKKFKASQFYREGLIIAEKSDKYQFNKNLLKVKDPSNNLVKYFIYIPNREKFYEAIQYETSDNNSNNKQAKEGKHGRVYMRGIQNKQIAVKKNFSPDFQAGRLFLLNRQNMFMANPERANEAYIRCLENFTSFGKHFCVPIIIENKIGTHSISLEKQIQRKINGVNLNDIVAGKHEAIKEELLKEENGVTLFDKKFDEFIEATKQFGVGIKDSLHCNIMYDLDEKCFVLIDFDSAYFFDKKHATNNQFISDIENTRKSVLKALKGDVNLIRFLS